MNIQTICTMLRIGLLLAPLFNRDGKLDGILATLKAVNEKLCGGTDGVFSSLPPDQQAEVDQVVAAIKDCCDCDDCDCD